jgi:hypothetical protein
MGSRPINPAAEAYKVLASKILEKVFATLEEAGPKASKNESNKRKADQREPGITCSQPGTTCSQPGTTCSQPVAKRADDTHGKHSGHGSWGMNPGRGRRPTQFPFIIDIEGAARAAGGGGSG